MYSTILDALKSDPKLYEPSKIAFWDDDHISKSMLANHLSATSDGATRNHAGVIRSADWIATFFSEGDSLLDLGCGPGIYAELFAEKGGKVNGIDISRRSIAYAKESAALKGLDIAYECKNYLEMDYQNQFDVVTLIYCDFGVLDIESQQILLEKIYTALKPGGTFVMDVFSLEQYANWIDGIKTTFEDGGFWSEKPYLCIKKDKRYEDDYFLEQYVIVTKEDCRTYNLWNHAFSKEELTEELGSAGFADLEFYSDIAGGQGNESSTICVVARKPHNEGAL
ncbi:MAG: class I SAM-dependent methyltransferase [Raoultibacter sp.]|jgi:SAM-dependent methyltransferase